MYVCFSHMTCQEVCCSPDLAENFPPLAGRFVAYVFNWASWPFLRASPDENNLGE